MDEFHHGKRFLLDGTMESGRSTRETRSKVNESLFVAKVLLPESWCRLMEKDNKKLRDDARKEYNDTIRVSPRVNSFHQPNAQIQSLVRFIRKRDPRYKDHLASQAQNSVSQPPNQDKLNSRILKQQAAEAYVEQEWQKVETNPLHKDLDWAVAEGEDLEEWECVACRKTFRSEAAWNSHERSKKHMKEVERLRKEMQEDDEELDLHLDNRSLTTPDEVAITPTLPPSPTLSNLSTLPSQQDIYDFQSSCSGMEDPSSISPVSDDDISPNRSRKTAKCQNTDGTESKDLLSKTPDVSSDNVLESTAITAESSETVEISKRDKRRARQQAKKKAETNKNEHLVSYFFSFVNCY